MFTDKHSCRAGCRLWGAVCRGGGGEGGGQRGQLKWQDVCLQGTNRGWRSEVGDVNNTLSCFRFFGLREESVAGFVVDVLCKWVKFCQKPVTHQEKNNSN